MEAMNSIIDIFNNFEGDKRYLLESIDGMIDVLKSGGPLKGVKYPKEEFTGSWYK